MTWDLKDAPLPDQFLLLSVTTMFLFLYFILSFFIPVDILKVFTEGVVDI